MKEVGDIVQKAQKTNCKNLEDATFSLRYTYSFIKDGKKDG